MRFSRQIPEQYRDCQDGQPRDKPRNRLGIFKGVHGPSIVAEGTATGLGLGCCAALGLVDGMSDWAVPISMWGAVG
jgi:hypothetical protein